MIKTQLRVPDDVKAWLDSEAARHERSLNGQIVWALKKQMAASAADHREETGAHVGKTEAPASRSHPEGNSR